MCSKKGLVSVELSAHGELGSGGVGVSSIVPRPQPVKIATKTTIINFTVKVGGFAVPFGVDVGAVSLIVSLTLFFGISLASKPPELDEDIEAVMDL